MHDNNSLPNKNRVIRTVARLMKTTEQFNAALHTINVINCDETVRPYQMIVLIGQLQLIYIYIYILYIYIYTYIHIYITTYRGAVVTEVEPYSARNPRGRGFASQRDLATKRALTAFGGLGKPLVFIACRPSQRGISGHLTPYCTDAVSLNVTESTAELPTTRAFITLTIFNTHTHTYI
jgi:hypothetical protein